MSRLYWRFVARITLIVRYCWREYREVNQQVRRPGQNVRGVDFWDVRPGSRVERYFEFGDDYEFDESSSGIVNAWPYKIDDDEELGPTWVLPILVEGQITHSALEDMGILPHPRNWNKAYTAVVGRGRPSLDAPFDEFDCFTPASHQAW